MYFPLPPARNRQCGGRTQFLAKGQVVAFFRHPGRAEEFRRITAAYRQLVVEGPVAASMGASAAQAGAKCG